jgi:hypothetical protein
MNNALQKREFHVKYCIVLQHFGSGCRQSVTPQ